MEKDIYIGTMLYGYCGGCFDKSYEDKRVEALGADWIVARDDDGNVYFESFNNRQEMLDTLLEYTEEKDDEDY